MEGNNKKIKLLKKYVSHQDNKLRTKQQQKQQKNERKKNFILKDNEEIVSNNSQSQKSESADQKKRRIESSSQQECPKKEDKQYIMSKKMNKKLKQALGINEEEEGNDFLQEVKIEGMNELQIKDYLKHNRHAKIEGEKIKQGKHKKKDKKIKIQPDEQNRFKQFQNSSSSDIQIPQQSRTIYRNKDGTIKQMSDQKFKEKQKQKVMDRLAEWEKGMNTQKKDEDEQDDEIALAKQQIWDDPMRRWQINIHQHPLQCKYDGYANRFNIKPGFRWDGVIRGNGYQNKYLQQNNLKKVQQMKNDREYLKNL